MAKRRRRAGKTKDRYDAEAPREEPADEQAAQPEGAGTSKTAGDFLHILTDGLKAAGQAAERFARTGVSSVGLEKLRLELRLAQARLGEGVLKCWDAAPDVGVLPTDPAVKEPARQVKELRRHIREMEQKIAELRK